MVMVKVMVTPRARVRARVARSVGRSVGGMPYLDGRIPGDARMLLEPE